MNVGWPYFFPHPIGMSTTDAEKRKRETEARYAAALELYRSTDLSMKEICERTDTNLIGFKGYLYRNHRELMFARHGIALTSAQAQNTKLRESKGQTEESQAKYSDAISACGDIKYIKYTITQIADIFHVPATGLANQLRNHFPEILERRELERLQRGIADNIHRGTPQRCKEQYAAAVEHLRNSDDTIAQTAQKYDLSYTGLRGHILFYHKELVAQRENKRKNATGKKALGSLTGNGARHQPSDEQHRVYEKAVSLYRTTAMTMKEIAATTGISLNGLRNYLRTWHVDLMLERRGASPRENTADALRTSKQYLKSTAAKYAEAIEFLKNSDLSTAEVAKRFSLHPESFRSYLYEHEPELAARLGMATLPNGKLVLARSARKYETAITLYRTSTESLKSIARRFGLTYNSVWGFIKRNIPEAIEAHNKLVEAANHHQQNQAPTTADTASPQKTAIK